MKEHRKWTTVFTYCKNVPIDSSLIVKIKSLIQSGKNVLIMIKKEDPENNPKYEPGEKFKAFGEALQDEFEQGKIIVSTVPDINEIIEIED